MTAAEFKKKWARYQGKETSAYQEHFNDGLAAASLAEKLSSNKFTPAELR
jgi:hypothetical protein